MEPGAGGHVKWFAVSSTIMVVGYVIAESVPLFSDVVGITGSLFSTTLGLTFPPMLYLGMYYQQNDVLEYKETNFPLLGLPETYSGSLIDKRNFSVYWIPNTCNKFN